MYDMIVIYLLSKLMQFQSLHLFKDIKPLKQFEHFDNVQECFSFSTLYFKKGLKLKEAFTYPHLHIISRERPIQEQFWYIIYSLMTSQIMQIVIHHNYTSDFLSRTNAQLFSSICVNIVLFSTHRGVTSKS